MLLAFVSNFLNHHQIPICTELKKRVDSFYFISTQSCGSQGYQVPIEADYVIHYDEESEKNRAIDIIINSDVVIFGACPNDLIARRMADNKLSFLYSERFFKLGTWRRFIPLIRKKIDNRIIKYRDNQLYPLCASAYLPLDLSYFGFDNEKCFKWGYFPELKIHESIKRVLDNKQCKSILWVSRFIPLKHPEYVIKLARRLKAEGYVFNINMIGDGDLKCEIESLINKYDLHQCVHLLGSKSHDEVMQYMEKSSIFLFTSDCHEGWGAVMNEAMNSGCAIVANRMVGSVPYLIKEKETGLSYNNQCEDMIEKVKFLLDNERICEKMGQNAYEYLLNGWSPEVAAERFVGLATALLNSTRAELIKDGVCSAAPIIKEYNS